MNQTKTFNDILFTHKLERSEWSIIIADDFNLFFTDLKRWVKNQHKPLSDDESKSIFVKIYNDIENQKYSNEFLFSSIELYIYTILGLIAKGEDGINFVLTEDMKVNWSDGIPKTNCETIFSTLIDQYKLILKDVYSEEELNNFILDAFLFNNDITDNKFKFEYHKNVKDFDNLIEIFYSNNK
jgi:hypothetical protein